MVRPVQAIDADPGEVAADYAGKGVKLVKINVDENKLIASQFRVQTIPTVYAVFQGQPVADLTPARTEGQIARALDQILSQLPVQGAEQQMEVEIAPFLEMASRCCPRATASAPPRSSSRCSISRRTMRRRSPAWPRALIATGHTAEARALLDALPEKAAADPLIARARAALALAEAAPEGVDTSEFERRIAADPDDHEARYELAGALLAAGNRDAAPITCSKASAATASGTRARRASDCCNCWKRSGSRTPGRESSAAALSAILFTDGRGHAPPVPVFPLAGALLFPRAQLPLHIFEPRYPGHDPRRARRRSAARHGPARDSGDRPTLFTIGCLGHISSVEELADGRFNLVLDGLGRFRIAARPRSTRSTARSTPIAAASDDDADGEPLGIAQRAELEREARLYADALGYQVDWTAVARLDDEMLVNGIAQIAPLDIGSKQALLEAADVTIRADLLVQFMQFQRMIPGAPTARRRCNDPAIRRNPARHPLLPADPQAAAL